MRISRVSTYLAALALPFALTGFAIAEPIFDLLKHTPAFLVARHNSPADVLTLTGVLSIALPLVLVLPAWGTIHRFPRFARAYQLTIASLLSGLLIAQLIHGWSEIPTGVFLTLVVVLAASFAYALLFTRWQMLARILAATALIFPLKFLLFSDTLSQVRGLAASSVTLAGELAHTPPIVFVIFDELPVATLLDAEGQVDGRYFPGFRRLQQISNWYFNATTVANATMISVPAILDGLMPDASPQRQNLEEQVPNLFTLLRGQYAYNVAETYTSLCPEELCPVQGPGAVRRLRALLMDLTAIYLHKVTPPAWLGYLPDVGNDWSGFFAAEQRAVPRIWARHVGKTSLIDRPAYFRQFISSITPAQGPGEKPTLNVLHIPFPHRPIAYLPAGRNYGREWVRGQVDGRWENHHWSLVSGRQRYFLQAQLADQLLGELLDHLEQSAMLENSLVVVVSDHGVSFEKGDWARRLSANNAGSVLRVPLFIKAARQMTGKRVTQPVMTIDILPTILSQLGADAAAVQLDGINLDSQPLPDSRSRQVVSNQRLRLMDEPKLAVEQIVADMRSQLKLDDEASGIWRIGPFDDQRGEELATICDANKGSLRYRHGKHTPLPNSPPDLFVPAFISGTIVGDFHLEDSAPFVISSNHLIAASGHLWKRCNRWRFAALVPPHLVEQPGWSPEISVLVNGQCLQQ